LTFGRWVSTPPDQPYMEALLIILCYAISGVTLYCMLRGSLPFEADNPLDLFEAIKEQE
jgi:hypothetical protein